VLAQTAIPFRSPLGYTHDAECARHAIGRRLVGWSEVAATLMCEFVTQIVPFDAEEYHDILLYSDNQFTVAILIRKARIRYIICDVNLRFSRISYESCCMYQKSHRRK
jgi:hypothetical protein